MKPCPSCGILMANQVDICPRCKHSFNNESAGLHSINRNITNEIIKKKVDSVSNYSKAEWNDTAFINDLNAVAKSSNDRKRELENELALELEEAVNHIKHCLKDQVVRGTFDGPRGTRIVSYEWRVYFKNLDFKVITTPKSFFKPNTMNLTSEAIKAVIKMREVLAKDGVSSNVGYAYYTETDFGGYYTKKTPVELSSSQPLDGYFFLMCEVRF